MFRTVRLLRAVLLPAASITKSLPSASPIKPLTATTTATVTSIVTQQQRSLVTMMLTTRGIRSRPTPRPARRNPISLQTQRISTTPLKQSIKPSMPKPWSHTPSTSSTAPPLTAFRAFARQLHTSTTSTPLSPLHRLVNRNFFARSRLVQRQRRAFSTASTSTTPPTSTNLDDLAKLAVPPPPLKRKVRWGLRIAQFFLFVIGFTATATAAFFYRTQIMTGYFDALTSWRLWRNGVQNVKELASVDYPAESLPFTVTGDVNADVFALQQVWFNHTFHIRIMMQNIINQIHRISTTYNDTFVPVLTARAAELTAQSKPGDESYNTFSLFVADLQELLNNSQLTYGELLEFSVLLSSADAGFALNTKELTDAEKETFFDQLHYSVEEAKVYIHRMHELYATVADQNLRLQRMQDHIADLSQYPAFRAEMLQRDAAYREKYDKEMIEIEQQLLAHHKRLTDPQPGEINGPIINLDDPELQQKIEIATNEAKNPPALHLDLESMKK